MNDANWLCQKQVQKQHLLSHGCDYDEVGVGLSSGDLEGKTTPALVRHAEGKTCACGRKRGHEPTADAAAPRGEVEQVGEHEEY